MLCLLTLGGFLVYGPMLTFQVTIVYGISASQDTYLLADVHVVFSVYGCLH